MRDRIERFIRKPFVRNIAAVTTGTASAHAITIVFAPIITRLYGPEAFGILGVFMSIVTIVVPLAALTFPIAIVLPKSDYEAVGLVRISMYATILSATAVGIIIVLFSESVIQLLQIEVIASYLLFIPLVMVFGAAVQIADQWLIRKKQFMVTAKVIVAHSLIVNSTKAGIGFYHPVAAVLVTIAIFGSLLQALMLAFGVKRASSNMLHSRADETTEQLGMLQLIKRYKDFPLYRTPQVTINAISESLPLLMLAAFSGPAVAGFYGIGRTVLSIPAALIGKSVMDVFYQRFNEAAQGRESLKALLVKATLGMAIMGVLPFAIMIAFGPWLFALVFGAEWIIAGVYARWMALWLFFRFINKPSVAAIPVLGVQKGLLIYELFSTGLKVLALAVGFYFFESDLLAIMLLSIAGTVTYVFLILWIITASSRFNKGA